MKELILMAAALSMAGGAYAQNDGGFDLGSQRKEIQAWQKVPGHVIDHNGLVINPTPKTMDMAAEGRYAFPKKAAKVKDVKNKFAGEIKELLPLPVDLIIDYGGKQAKNAGVDTKEGAYLLNVGKNGVLIIGYDERGAFYGLQTLRQILNSEQAQQGSIPYMKIVDSPDLDHRGVVEGFYGTPWSHEVRLSLIDFYGKNKMNSYLYGPKDDPYHSSPNWRLPYPEDEAKNIHELVEACKKARVNFIWAIHPGKDIKWNEEDYNNLVNKFDMMYDLGVRSFAIFFDDIEGEGTNPVKQVELLNRLTKEYVETRDGVQPLIICPTDYSRMWAGTSHDSALPTYGRLLDPSVEVFYTGDVVCSDLTHDTMEFFDNLIQRPGFYWWNFPVTDYARHILMQGPTYGLDPTMTRAEVSGIVSNPMEHGEASKLALYGVADYSWNMADYNAIDNWERGLTEMTPNARDAYRTFAIHSCDTETGYRRDESWETETFRLNEYTPEKAAALREEYAKVAAAPAQLEAGCDNKLLLGELRPWLTEFGKLGQRGLNTLDLIEIYRSGNDSLFWTNYVANEFTPEQRAEWEKHKSGTMKLQPFMDFATTDMLIGFSKRLTGEAPMFFQGVGSYPNLSSSLAQKMFDNDSTSYWTSTRAQKAGEWVGADLGDVRMVDSIFIQQGRNSVDDVDYYDNCVLQASKDGKEWVNLTEPLEKTYEISWSGNPVEARYVRLLRLDSKRRNWTSVRQFNVNPVSAERLGFAIQLPATGNPLLAFDNNPSTAAVIGADPIKFDVKPGAVILLSDASKESPLEVVIHDGNVTVNVTVDTPYVTLPVGTGVSAMEVGAPRNAKLYEVIFNSQDGR